MVNLDLIEINLKQVFEGTVTEFYRGEPGSYRDDTIPDKYRVEGVTNGVSWEVLISAPIPKNPRVGDKVDVSVGLFSMYRAYLAGYFNKRVTRRIGYLENIVPEEYWMKVEGTENPFEFFFEKEDLDRVKAEVDLEVDEMLGEQAKELAEMLGWTRPKTLPQRIRFEREQGRMDG